MKEHAVNKGREDKVVSPEHSDSSSSSSGLQQDAACRLVAPRQMAA